MLVVKICTYPTVITEALLLYIELNGTAYTQSFLTYKPDLNFLVTFLALCLEHRCIFLFSLSLSVLNETYSSMSMSF